jgi:hypothetical protein
MAKKQTRRSISVSRTTYERLKTFCETNNISMSQFVEARVGDFLGEGASLGTTSIVPSTPRPTIPAPVKPVQAPVPAQHHHVRSEAASASAPSRPSAPAIPMTSAAARYAVEPPPPVINKKPSEPAPAPAEKRPDQIFTF